MNALLIAFSGCEDFVNVDLPRSELSNSLVFENEVTAASAVTAMYSKMNTTGFANGGIRSLTILMGLSADDLFVNSSGSEYSFFINNNHLSTSPIVASFWGDCYFLIYSANSVIEGLQQSEALTDSIKDQLIGEALFVRAFSYFYLVNLFGDVPYSLQTDYRVNSQLVRSQMSTVYDGIISDLVMATEYLSEDYITSGRVRPNQRTAEALLSRVYLYRGEWEKSATIASEIIEDSRYKLEHVDSVFLRDTEEAIWQLMPWEASPVTNNTQEANAFVPIDGDMPLFEISSQLLGNFSDEDLRKKEWISGVENNESEMVYYPYKYKERESTNPAVEFSIVFRLAEIYLIRAEAYAQLDRDDDALSDINNIRNRAGLTSLVDISGDQILTAVANERFNEFFAEWGHRWFDLKRTDKIDEVLSAIKPSWDSRHELLPIPASEILINRNLDPNPGY